MKLSGLCRDYVGIILTCESIINTFILKKSIILFLAIIGGVFSCSTNENQSDKKQTNQVYHLRFDGVYKTQTSKFNNSESNNYIRFYEDGIAGAISYTSETSIEHVKAFTSSYEVGTQISRGKYDKKGNKVYFTATSSNGSVVYNIVLKDEKTFSVSTKSLINGHEATKDYYFIKF